MPRFYCQQPLASGAIVPLPDSVAHHLRVLRLTEGDIITLFNGEGGEFSATLAETGKKHANAVVGEFFSREAELPFALTLAQALPEASKMDWIIEKAVELGAATIQPISAQRCVVKLSGERAEKRHAHWHSVIAAASEQCGRNRLAQLEPLIDFASWIAKPATQARILFSPRATQTLSVWTKSQAPQSLTLMIGPEGGFTEQEELLAVSRGALLLSLGNRVLRTETAGIAALSALSAVWG